ncbi:VOC family protein [Variovorax sp. dw_308]|uniref:VOC family protein n=1 Tax=Variovorax sp. dw_308 TaxID=2721546 RepID=UPI001C473DBB|nr:VOC family protein [Variovorax sp. dw_308]
MFSHVYVSVGDFERALAFHGAVMDGLGLALRFCERDKPWAGWHSAGDSRPFFVICKPFDGQPHDPGNGQMVAFAAADRATVRAAYQSALARGGTCEGPPGLRPQYHANYYGAYFRDPDGNKFCVACHAPEDEDSGAAS